jgi:hypothetical protein
MLSCSCSTINEFAMIRKSTPILLSGWGAFLAIAGVVSLALDLAAPRATLSDGSSFPLFLGGSWTLGWVGVMGIMLLPAIAMREFGKVPIDRGLAFLWCAAVFFGWVYLHVIGPEGQTPLPARPNLSMLGGLVLCWRLLTRPREPAVEDGNAPRSAIWKFCILPGDQCNCGLEKVCDLPDCKCERRHVCTDGRCKCERPKVCLKAECNCKWPKAYSSQSHRSPR